jgi:hypothetical protein
LFDEQNNPLRLEHQRGINRAQDAQLPGLQADSSIKQRKDRMEGELYPDALKAARQKFMQDASDHDLKMLENAFQEMTYSLDPRIKKRGLDGLLMHKDMVKEREKLAGLGANQIAGIRATGEETRKTQKEAIEGGKWKGGSNKAAPGTLDHILSLKDPLQQLSTINLLAKQAEMRGDAEEQNYWANMAQSIYANAQAKAAGGAPVYMINPETGAITQATRAATLPLDKPVPMPFPTGGVNPRELVQSDLASGAQFSSPEVESRVRQFAGGGGENGKPPAQNKLPPEAEAWVQKAMSLNPKMTREAIIEQGKKKGKF